MRILVISDTHGNETALFRVVEAQPTARVVIHLGDGVEEAEAAAAAFPDREFHLIRGNNDWYAGRSYPLSEELLLGGRRLFCTHGHHYRVKMGLYDAVCAARERQADLLLFGHTHQPLTDYEDGLYLMNPGSLGYGGTYGYVDITPAGIVTNLALDLPRRPGGDR